MIAWRDLIASGGDEEEEEISILVIPLVETPTLSFLHITCIRSLELRLCGEKQAGFTAAPFFLLYCMKGMYQ